MTWGEWVVMVFTVVAVGSIIVGGIVTIIRESRDTKMYRSLVSDLDQKIQLVEAQTLFEEGVPRDWFRLHLKLAGIEDSVDELLVRKYQLESAEMMRHF